MRLVVMLLSLLSGFARAQGLSVPVGLPPPRRVAEIPQGFTLNAAVLERYGYTLDKYNGMPSEERQRVSDWIEILEHDRLVAEARAAQAQPPRLKLSPETQAAIDRIKAGLSLDFDRAQKGASGGSWDPGLVPSVDLAGPGALNGDQYDLSGALRRFSLTDPKNDLRLSFGNLGVESPSPLVEPSPYLSIEKGWGGSGSLLDWNVRGSASMVNLGARLYTDDAPALDAQINQGLNTLGNSAGALGLTPGQIGSLSQNLSYSSSFDQQWLFIGSLLGRVGRSYSLLGDSNKGVDWGWTAMGLLRADDFFPNASLDQTAGLRMRPDRDHGIGIFGGVTEGIGIFSKSMVADSLSAGSLKTDIEPQAAPHATIASWGKMPYLSPVEYTVSATQQWNPWTTVRSLSASLSAPVGNGVKVGAFGSYTDESGPDIEYDRSKASAGLMVKPNPNLGISAQYFNQNASYGDAHVQNQGVTLNLTLTETGSNGGLSGSATMESLFGGQDHLLPNDASSQLVKTMQSLLNTLTDLKNAGLASQGGAAQTWQDVQAAWNKLDPSVQQMLGDAYRSAVPGGPSLAQIIATSPSTAAALNRLVDLLTDVQVLDRLLVRYLRSQILKELSHVEIPVLGRNIRMSAPMVLAAANAYSLSLTPLPPITSKDLTSLDAFLLGKLSSAAGCPSGAQPQATTDCILSQLPADQANKLRNEYGSGINAVLMVAVGWPSSVIRTEMNQLALQVILASEQLNELSVDKGERIGDLNVRALQSSFAYLDDRTRKVESRVLKAAQEDIQEDLKGQEETVKATLTDYGSSRLAWLQSQPAWPAGVRIAIRQDDWAPLLAVYGDQAIFDLILKCKAKLAAKGGSQGLLISFDRVSPMNGLVVRSGNPAELHLPSKAVDLSAFDLSL